jgi:hypothetical protein
MASEFFGFEQDVSQPRFPAMRIVARAYEIMAIIVLVLAIIALLIALVAIVRNPSNVIGELFGWGIVFAWATLTAILLLFNSQSIRLLLQIEQNTRETQQACRQLAEHFSAIQHEP